MTIKIGDFVLRTSKNGRIVKPPDSLQVLAVVGIELRKLPGLLSEYDYCILDNGSECFASDLMCAQDRLAEIERQIATLKMEKQTISKEVSRRTKK